MSEDDKAFVGMLLVIIGISLATVTVVFAMIYGFGRVVGGTCT